MACPTCTICEVPLISLANDNPLSITLTATSCRYRLVDCNHVTEQGILRIVEFPDFPHVAYSAVSYVWRGNTVDPAKSGATFAVVGAEDADPISIDVLSHACAASVQQAINYLWLDRLCIMQEDENDRAWQISQMYRIYQSCSQCMVIPGGIQRLVRLDEETAWIHRGWTLQEVLAPKTVMVLFAWQVGSGTIQSGDAQGTVTEVIAERSAMAPVADVINACVVGYISFTGASVTNYLVRTNILGYASPNVAALAAVMSHIVSSDPDARSHAIWKSALLRTSSRPVDMVFSIMGLFGVNLDAHAFHKDDRVGATIALAKAILKDHGTASWLGISFRLPPCKVLSTFPIFPQTSVTGKALVGTKANSREVGEMVDGEYPNALGLEMRMPYGSMDDDGYFTFSRKAVRVAQQPRTKQASQSGDVNEKGVIKAMDGTVWEIRSDAEEGEAALIFAVLVGWFDEYYPGATLMDNKRKIKGMVIREHAPGKFNLVSFFALNFQLRAWVMAWKERGFSVGGPGALGSTEIAEYGEPSWIEKEQDVEVQDSTGMRVPDTSNWKYVGLQQRKARWAAPQSLLEAFPRRKATETRHAK